MDEPPPSPKSAAGNNMLPPCITRLTRLQDLRLAGDWRRPKVRTAPPPPHLDADAAQHDIRLRRGAIPQRILSPPFLPSAQTQALLQIQYIMRCTSFSSQFSQLGFGCVWAPTWGASGLYFLVSLP